MWRRGGARHSALTDGDGVGQTLQVRFEHLVGRQKLRVELACGKDRGMHCMARRRGRGRGAGKVRALS